LENSLIAVFQKRLISWAKRMAGDAVLIATVSVQIPLLTGTLTGKFAIWALKLAL
jgi:hypothetical protein